MFHVFAIAASQALKNTQLERGVKVPLTLIQDVTTRWNSQLAMVKRLLQLQPYIFPVCHGGMYGGKEVMSAKERGSLYLPDTTWKVS